MFAQSSLAPDVLACEILDLLRNPQKRSAMQRALGEWNAPAAAGNIAERILNWPAEARNPVHLPAPKLKHQPGIT